jgi:outer membrane protein insertion porin family
MMTILKHRVFTCVAAALALVIISVPATTASGQSGPPVIGEVRITVTDPPDDKTPWQDIARGLMRLKEGDIYSDAALVASLAALENADLFARIHVPDPDLDQPEIVLEIHVRPFPRIKDIRISGGFPLLRNEILTVMTIYTGDAYKPGLLEAQAGYIETLFQNRGYISPDVELTAESDDADGHMIIHVRIHKGPAFKVTSVSLTGNRSFSNIRLRTRLSTWHASLLFGDASRFIQEDLDQDVTTLRDFYRSKGFYDAAVTADVERDAASETAYVRIRIDEGPLYRIDINGNNAFYAWTLRRDLPLAEDGNQNDMGLRKGIRVMKQRYEEAGYPEIDIAWNAEAAGRRDRPERHVRIDIKEGLRHIVNSIEITGNRSVSRGDIRDQMLTRTPGWIAAGQFNATLLQDDIRAIRALYLRHGFLEASIKETVRISDPGDKNNIREVDIQIFITEGPRTLWVKSI